jgi:uncharacterized protein (TIGR02466 family)
MSDVLDHIVNLFPLSVYISDVAQHSSLKGGLVPRIKALPPYQPESRYAWTGDVNGHGFIHLDEDFKPWLDAMVPHIQRYLEFLQLRTEHLDIYFQRSWPAVAKRHQEIAPHSHENAHISLVYYLKKPENAGGLRLLMSHVPNEIVPNLFSAAVAVQPFFVERTPFNANHVDLDLNEGQVLIFPSKTQHQTIASESDDDRISLVADIAVMLKADSECEKFMPDFSLWKKI